jgi:hypothetical protein
MMFGVAAAGDEGGPQGGGARTSDAAVRVTQLEGKAPKISFRWENIGVERAFTELFKATNQSFVWAGRLEERLPISATMTNVDIKTALDLICQVAGLTYEQRNGVWVISQGPQMVTVGGARVPLLGAVPDVSGDVPLVFDGERVGSFLVRPRGSGAAVAPTWERRVVGPLSPSARVEFPGSETLVDLDVKDSPLSEVARKLSAAVNASLESQAQEQEREAKSFLATPKEPPPTFSRPSVDFRRVEIVAHESLRSVRVTARVYRWPAGQVLGMVLEQAGLVYTSQVDEPPFEPDPSKEDMLVRKSLTTIYLVPKPMLEVTGPGVPGRGGVGSGGGGGPVSGVRGGGGGGSASE